ncbi:MAG: toxin-antitoxin system HicB family antitoxin [Dehalococcoidia bacterium]|nr:toxin-antitoxin system HicB family antitoxin [Dehalococcoidia bacterium]
MILLAVGFNRRNARGDHRLYSHPALDYKLTIDPRRPLLPGMFGRRSKLSTRCSRMKVSSLLRRPYHIQLVRDETDDGQAGWVASVLELPGCLSQGDTPAEATEHIYDAMAAWFEAMVEDGQPIPDPAVEPAASGRILLRLPASLHERLAIEAEREGVSLNQFAVGVLAASVGWRQPAAASGPSGRAATG